MGVIRSFKDLDAWRVGMDVVVLTYTVAKHLPLTERFELAAQMRRAAVSVPSNVAEGQSSGTRGRYRSHVSFALGSLGELETQVELARRLNYVSAEATRKLEEQLARCGQLLHGLRRSIITRQIVSVLAWLALLAGAPLLWSFRTSLGDVHLVLLDKDILALTLAAFDFVLSWIHVDVLAHWLS